MSTSVVVPHENPSVLKVGWIARLTAIAALIPAIILVIGKISDDASPLGLPPYVLVYATVAALVAGALVRGVIAAVAVYFSNTTEVKSGFSTYLTVGAAILGGIPVVLQDLASATGPLNVDPTVWVKATSYLVAATTVMKGLQFIAATANAYGAGQALPVYPAPGNIPTDPPPVDPSPTDPPPVVVPDPPADPVDPPAPPDQGDAGPGGFPKG